MFVHVSERDFFSPSCSKIDLERDWNSKIFQNVRNLGFFGQTDGFFREKVLNFFKITERGKLFVECDSNGKICLKCLSTLFVSFS